MYPEDYQLPLDSRPEETHSSSSRSVRLEPSYWRSAREDHRRTLEFWAHDRVNRAHRNLKHPVYDFLFTYYSYRPGYLLRWSPGANIELLGASQSELDWPLDYEKTASGYIIPASSFPQHRLEYLRWATRYLKTTHERPASFNCFGLHEWAMVYQVKPQRHSDVPIRLSPSEIAAFLESSELRCSHYDAYRFFTPEASPRNRWQLTRQITTDYDQPGCVHVTMDLYRFAHKISPWCPGDLLADAFLLAVAARELDMRASPYDLRSFGFEPICIETLDGRAQYTRTQCELRERAIPIRTRLLEVYQTLLRACASVTP